MMSEIKPQKRRRRRSSGRELKSSLDFERTPSHQIAGFITGMFGSMRFLVICIIVILFWMAWNLNYLPTLKPFDAYPFPILELSVSIFAVILSVSVLINQNRQGRIDKIKKQVEFEVNVRAESEVTKVLNMLHQVHKKMGIDTKEDKELEEMKEQTDIKKIHQKLDTDDDLSENAD